MELNGELDNLDVISSAQLYIQTTEQGVLTTMYTITMTEEQLKLHVTGLDSTLRMMFGQAAQSQSPGAMLKQMIPQLILIDKEFENLGAALNAPIGASSEDKKPLVNGASAS